MTPLIEPRRALEDPQLLGNALPATAQPMRTLILAALGATLSAAERDIFQQFTGRSQEPGQAVKTFCAVKGRRARFSSAMGSVIIPFTAGLCRHNLRRGEVGYLLVCAQDQRTADQILDYAEEAFRASPMLRQLIESRVQHELRLTNNIVVTVRAADSKRLRGLTLIGFVGDEIGHWPTDETGANADVDVLAAVKPALLTTAGQMWIGSTPYARRGELWRLFSKHYGQDGDPLTLVAKGTTIEFNPTIEAAEVERALAEDEAKYRAEFMAQFRTDIETFISIEAVRACISAGTYERRPQPFVSYSAFVDPSGGSADSMTLAIGHCDHARQTVVLDCLREVKPPFSPEAVAEQFSKTLGDYSLDHVVGDRFGGLWPVEQFAKFGVRFEQAARPKSDLYADLLPLLNSGRIELLDGQPKLIAQLTSLERRTSRSGRDSIDHPPSGHDDLANCLAGLASINGQFGKFDSTFSFVDGNEGDDTNVSFRRARFAQYLRAQGIPL
jgi:hypothetical protein